MKTASLLYPYDAVLKVLQTLLKRKGCDILCVDKNEGTIKAYCKKSFFLEHPKTIDIKLEKKNQNITNIILQINSNQHIYDHAVTNDERMEEKFLDAIDDYF